MFNKKTTIITGSGQGIGKSIAEHFLKEGASIVISDLSKKKCDKVIKEFSEKYPEEKMLGIKCDVSKKKDVQNLIKKTKKQFGKLDIFVNNAGIYPSKKLTEITEEEWNSVLSINLDGTFYSIQEAGKAMKKGGKIVIISSIASIIGMQGMAHYCASKAGVNGLVRSAATELAKKEINVNAVAPGAVETPGTKKLQNKKVSERMLQRIPLKRLGKPEDIANSVLFLSSDKSSYITGQVIVVDGGWTIQ